MLPHSYATHQRTILGKIRNVAAHKALRAVHGRFVRKILRTRTLFAMLSMRA